MTFVPKIKRHVTLPLFKMVKDKPLYVKFDTAMFEGRKIDDQKDAATLINVTDLTTGEVGQIIVPAVLKSTILENYEGESYKGKCFMITFVPKDQTGNTYNMVSLTEIDDPADEAQEETVEKVKPKK